jgi:hypothetical protein
VAPSRGLYFQSLYTISKDRGEMDIDRTDWLHEEIHQIRNPRIMYLAEAEIGPIREESARNSVSAFRGTPRRF